MLSMERGGSSSRIETGLMGKPKMRKEGLNLWWISEQSPRVFPLIESRMFSFMKTRLSLSDADNLSIRIFILSVVYICTEWGYCWLISVGWLFLQYPVHQKKSYACIWGCQPCLYLVDLFQKGYGRGRWRPTDLITYICPCCVCIGISWVAHRNGSHICSTESCFCIRGCKSCMQALVGTSHHCTGKLTWSSITQTLSIKFSISALSHCFKVSFLSALALFSLEKTPGRCYRVIKRGP